MEKTKEGIDRIIYLIETMWESGNKILIDESAFNLIEDARVNLLKWAKSLKVTFEDELSSCGQSAHMQDYKTLLADAKELSAGDSSPSFEKSLGICLKAYLAAKTGGLVKDE